jgi:hypothetical protein
MKREVTTYVTLGAVTYEVEGTYYPSEPYNGVTPAEKECFEIKRIFCDLKTQKDPSKLVTADVTDIINDDDVNAISEKINNNLEAFKGRLDC